MFTIDSIILYHKNQFKFYNSKRNTSSLQKSKNHFLALQLLDRHYARKWWNYKFKNKTNRKFAEILKELARVPELANLFVKERIFSCKKYVNIVKKLVSIQKNFITDKIEMEKDSLVKTWFKFFATENESILQTVSRKQSKVELILIYVFLNKNKSDLNAIALYKMPTMSQLIKLLKYPINFKDIKEYFSLFENIEIVKTICES